MSLRESHSFCISRRSRASDAPAGEVSEARQDLLIRVTGTMIMRSRGAAIAQVCVMPLNSIRRHARCPCRKGRCQEAHCISVDVRAFVSARTRDVRKGAVARTPPRKCARFAGQPAAPKPSALVARLRRGGRGSNTAVHPCNANFSVQACFASSQAVVAKHRMHSPLSMCCRAMRRTRDARAASSAHSASVW